MIINFPKLLERIVTSSIGNQGIGSFFIAFVYDIQSIILGIVGSQPEGTFRALLFYGIFGLWVYLLIVVVFTLRHRDVTLITLAVLGLVIGFFSLHIVSLIVASITWILWIISVLFNFIGFVFSTIFSFLVKYRLWIFVISSFIFIVFLTYAFRDNIIRLLFSIALAAGLIYAINRLFPSLWPEIVNIWTNYILRAISFLVTLVIYVFLFLIIVLGVLGTLSTFGRVIVDQFKSAWDAGGGRKNLLLCSFGIGTALAFIFLTSAATPGLSHNIDIAWASSWFLIDQFIGTHLGVSAIANVHIGDIFARLMVGDIHSLMVEHFTETSAPVHDTFMLLVVLVVSYMGIIRRIFSAPSNPEEFSSITFYPREFFQIIGDLLFQIRSAVVQNQSQRW